MSNPVIIQIFLRGAQDGLSWCAPVQDSYYQSQRGSLAIPTPNGANGVVDLDGYFALPAAAASLASLFSAGDVAFAHSVGVDPNQKDRSHFHSQYKFETGDPSGGSGQGWLGNTINKVSSTAVLKGLSHSALLVRSLFGGNRTLAIADPTAFDLPGNPVSVDSQKDALRYMYKQSAEPLKGGGARFRQVR